VSGRGAGGDTHSGFSGTAQNVVQGRDISGGVHVHVAEQSPRPVPRQLPGNVRGFVNRVRDLARLDELMAAEEEADAPVIVVTGTAGVGKTSLAVHWAHRTRARFPDGQLYVNLRGYDPGAPLTAGQALEHFLLALGVPAAAIPADPDARAAAFRTLLADRRMLVLLDNASSVAQVRPLLPGSGASLTLVTSRNRLSGLVVRDGARRLGLDVLDEHAAVELLHATTTAYRSDEEAELAELARLCARLPLALRVAAERAATRPRTPLGALIADLRDESSLWDALSSEDDEADTVRAVFAWSYRSLSPEAARLFRLLGLHPGPQFSTDAAAALAALPPQSARRLLDSLVGVHLLEEVGRDRYQFHDLLRAYATDQTHRLDPAEERDAAVTRVLGWYLAAGVALQRMLSPLSPPVPEPKGSREEVPPPAFSSHGEAMGWFRTERGNLAAAVRAADAAGQPGTAWRIAAALRAAYAWHNFFEDWISTTRVGLNAARRCGDETGQALLHESLGMAFRQSDRLTEAAEHLDASLRLRRRTGDRLGEAWVLNLLAMVNQRRRFLREACDNLIACLRIHDELRHDLSSQIPRVNLTVAYQALGRVEEARALAEQTRADAAAAGNRNVEFNTLVILAEIHAASGDAAAADRYAAEAAALAPGFDSDVTNGFLLLAQARVHLSLGRAAEALGDLQDAAALHRRLGDRGREAEAWDLTGAAYRRLERHEEAVPFHRQAATVFRELGDRWRTAVALDGLATALREAGEDERALPVWREASDLLAGFDDEEAVTLRAAVSTAIRAVTPGGDRP
jgi:tetratricopeptide (TPR) repeat protein